MERFYFGAILVVGVAAGMAMAAVPSTTNPYQNGEVLSASKLNSDFTNIEARLAALEARPAQSGSVAFRVVQGPTATVSGNAQGVNVLAACNQNEVAVGGGFVAVDSAVWAYRSHPDGARWSSYFNNSGPTASDVFTYAVCAPK